MTIVQKHRHDRRFRFFWDTDPKLLVVAVGVVMTVMSMHFALAQPSRTTITPPPASIPTVWRDAATVLRRLRDKPPAVPLRAAGQRLTESVAARDGDAATLALLQAAVQQGSDLPAERQGPAALLALGVLLADGRVMALRDDLASVDHLSHEAGTPGLSDGAAKLSERDAPKVDLAGTTGSRSLSAYVERCRLRGRHDLAQHFFVSAALAVTMDRQQSVALGLAKELADSRGGSGFSYVDLLADTAGANLAEAVVKGTRTPAELLALTMTDDLLPPIADLPEGLSLSEWLAVEKKTKKSHRQWLAEISRRLGTPATED